MNLLTYGRVIALVGIGAFAWFAYGVVNNMIAEYRRAIQESTTLKRDIQLRDAREKSLRRLIERRDLAIEVSKCKKEIQKWVKHPETRPEPFDPFGRNKEHGGQ